MEPSPSDAKLPASENWVFQFYFYNPDYHTAPKTAIAKYEHTVYSEKVNLKIDWTPYTSWFLPVTCANTVRSQSHEFSE